MAMVITRPLGLAMVTAEAIMAVVMAVVMVVIEAVTAEVIMAAVLGAFIVEGGGMAAGLEAAFTVVIDKNGNITKQN